jgi:hypothetical protein
MLRDLDDSLAALLDELLELPKKVTFDRPGATGWVEAPKQATLNCSLSHLDEDQSRRSAEWADVRDTGGLVTARQPPVRWMKVTYRVTAWAADVATEHELLGEVLQAFVVDRLLDVGHLVGSLADGDDHLSVQVAPASQRHQHVADATHPLVGRPALELSVVIPVRPHLHTDIAAPARELELGMQHRGPGVRPIDVVGQPTADMAVKKWTAFRVRET